MVTSFLETLQHIERVSVYRRLLVQFKICVFSNIKIWIILRFLKGEFCIKISYYCEYAVLWKSSFGRRPSLSSVVPCSTQIKSWLFVLGRIWDRTSGALIPFQVKTLIPLINYGRNITWWTDWTVSVIETLIFYDPVILYFDLSKFLFFIK